jgi:signal transduction histidine kinase
MTFPEITEVTARLVMAYLAQCLLGVIMFFIFRHFSKIYVRRFLRAWSRSWIAFAVYSLCTALLFFTTSDEQLMLQLFLSFFAQLGSYLQIFLILSGNYQLVFERPIKRRVNNIITMIFIVLSCSILLVFGRDTSSSTENFLLLTGTRTLIPAAGYMFAGFVVWSNLKFTQGFGQKLLASTFILFSLDQLIYFAVAAYHFWKKNPSLPNYFGLIDLLLIAVMGLAMVMWLLENEREKLDHANKELDSFLYSTSHDLRAPIASILGLTYLGKVELQEERARTFMGLIEDRIRKLDLVVADILSLARTKKLELRIERIDFDELLEDTIVDVRFNKGASAISLIYDKSIQNHFQSDYHQMKVILGNLISNAVKYHNVNQDSPYIKVLFTKTADHVEISVEDNGQGIPKESMSKVFDMFYRASSNVEGTGLGLYIVQEALAKIKGKISVKSEFGKGTTFTIFLEHGHFNHTT